MQNNYINCLFLMTCVCIVEVGDMHMWVQVPEESKGDTGVPGARVADRGERSSIRAVNVPWPCERVPPACNN